MHKSMTFRQWLLRLLGVGKDKGPMKARQQARDSLMCEIEQIMATAKKDPHGRNH